MHMEVKSIDVYKRHEQYQLLAEDGMLVKRPIIVGEDFVLTGFKEKEWEEVL